MEQQYNSFNKPQEYIIVKNANEKAWRGLFLEDPRLSGVKLNHSAFFSFAGKMSEINLSYINLDHAKSDLVKILDFNPYGGYDVCPLVN